MQEQIEVTEQAESFLLNKLEGKDKMIGIRLGVKDSGCAEYSYDLGFAEEIKNDDLVFGKRVKVVVSQKNMRYLKGTVVDCIADGMSQMLKFNNPNADNACGCGESFSMKK